MDNFNISVYELAAFLASAVFLGIVIHFFIISRKGLKSTNIIESQKVTKNLDEWKLKYFNDIEKKDHELSEIKERMVEAEENTRVIQYEVEELSRKNKNLKAELEAVMSQKPASQPNSKMDYFNELLAAKTSLQQHNDRINHLLEQIDFVRENEEKQLEIIRSNEELNSQIGELKSLVTQKEREINNIRQKAHLTTEMTSMLDNAYTEFNTLQDKMKKLESQVSASRMMNMEFEELKEAHLKMTREFEEQKAKLQSLVTENQQLTKRAEEAEDKLRESNFQRQQLQKRITYLEELNSDLQAVTDANKKLMGQLKRIGELESMLNVVSEERDELLRKTQDEDEDDK
jgi:chromosome segregation ATPase